MAGTHKCVLQPQLSPGQVTFELGNQVGDVRYAWHSSWSCCCHTPFAALKCHPGFPEAMFLENKLGTFGCIWEFRMWGQENHWLYDFLSLTYIPEAPVLHWLFQSTKWDTSSSACLPRSSPKLLEQEGTNLSECACCVQSGDEFPPCLSWLGR